MPDDHPAADTDAKFRTWQSVRADVMATGLVTEAMVSDATSELRARLDIHRALHLHDAALTDLRELWAIEHPDGAEPWEAL